MQSGRFALAEGVRYVRHDRIIRRLALHGAVSNLPLTGYQALLVVFLVREIGLSPGTVGLLLTLTALGGVAGGGAGATAGPPAR